MEKPLKIAVCFSGQIRTGVKASKNLLNFFGDLLDNIDFFVHTWDVDTPRAPLNLASCSLPVQPVSSETHNEFKKIYNPIDYVVENKQTFSDKIFSLYGSTGMLVHLWHSSYTSNNFKKLYEKNNNFKYDYVVRLRPDCLFPQDRKLVNDLKEVELDTSAYYVNRLFGDSYHISTSEIMDLASDFYLKGDFYGNHFWPMEKFEKYLNNLNISIIDFKDNRTTILRKEFDYLDPLRNYWQANMINCVTFDCLCFAKEFVVYTYQNFNDPDWLIFCKKNLQELVPEEAILKKYFDFYESL